MFRDAAGTELEIPATDFIFSKISQQDIFRKYPHSYESIIPSLSESIDSLDEPESKAALIWIIGEYAELLDDAQILLSNYLASFKEESPQVQLQLLTAVVKLFLKKPSKAQETVQSVLQTASQLMENPDLRDRAYIYWRLLSTNPEAAKVGGDFCSIHSFISSW